MTVQVQQKGFLMYVRTNLDRPAAGWIDRAPAPIDTVEVVMGRAGPANNLSRTKGSYMLTLRRTGIELAAIALAFGASATVMAPATLASPVHDAAQVKSAAVQPMTDPPGSCNADEEGVVKLDSNTEVLYRCDYVPGEDYYWISLWKKKK
jgi:hypothetical protein